MLDPQHNCWWSCESMCELQFRNNILYGAGVSLRVLLVAYPAATMTWYSGSWMIEEQGDVFVAGTAIRLPKRQSYIGPVTRALHPEPVEEYCLLNSALPDLGIVETDESFELATGSPMTVAIWMHDDCFFSVQISDDGALTRLIESILSMHSYYLAESVNWGHTMDALMSIVKRGKTLRMKSDRTAKRFAVTQRRFWHKQVLACEIVDGNAVLR